MHRGIKSADSDGFRDPMDWNHPITDEELNALGADGWELVSVVPASSYGGQLSSRLVASDMTDRHEPWAVATDAPIVSGVTTVITYIFKRPLAH